MPGIGLFYIFIMERLYGRIVNDSKVVRFSMYIPFCLPSTPLVAIVIDMAGYFRHEAGSILFMQHAPLIIILPMLFLKEILN